MLYFIIPLRDRNTTSNWSGVCRLLERTLASACGQLHEEYRAIVVCHSRPEGIHVPSRCEFLSAPFPSPVLSPHDDGERRLFLMRTDKGRKLLHGLARARSDPGSHVMFLDADDLISNRLAGFVAEQAGANGWYIDRGYRLDEHLKHVVFWRRRFYEECGSSYLIRSDLAPFPERLDDTRDFSDYFVRRYVVHAYVRSDLERRGTPLVPLPFYGAIYTFNDRNIFATRQRAPDPLWRTMARLRREFGIVPVQAQSTRVTTQ
jgi:hypothetical protein